MCGGKVLSHIWDEHALDDLIEHQGWKAVALTSEGRFDLFELLSRFLKRPIIIWMSYFKI